jgi:hypothetical protein
MSGRQQGSRRPVIRVSDRDEVWRFGSGERLPGRSDRAVPPDAWRYWGGNGAASTREARQPG